MHRLQFGVRFLFMALLVCVAFAAMPLGDADAKLPKKSECSAEGQQPCPAVYKGPRCDVGLGIFSGKCRKCGGEGQRACPRSAKGKPCFDGRMKIDGKCYAKCGGPNEKACAKIKRGYPCRGSYEPDSRGFCKPCGGDGQTVCRAFKEGKQCQSGLTKIKNVCQRCGNENERACPVLKAGKQCGSGLTKIQGYCRQCGGPNQQACPKLASGYPCRGKYEPDRSNICRPCGGNDQTPCRALKAGRQCDGGLHKIDNICQACGDANQRACPKIYAGYPCRGKFEPDRSNICKPCGSANQKACRALKAGKRCEPGTANIKGYCITCGGPDQPACPKLASGYPCRGEYEPNERGICKPCGGTGQTACRVLKAGRQCEVGATERDGVCVTCGGEGQRACKITDKGSACEDGLTRGLNGICKITTKGLVKRAALAELKNIGQDVMPILNLSTQLGENEGVQRSLHNAETGEGNATPDVDVPPTCLGNRYGAVTVGIGGELGAFMNFEGETGVAIRCGRHAKDQKDTKLYSSGSINWRIGGGASVAFTAGLWVDDFNQLRGLSHGYVIDIRDAIKSGLAIKQKDISDKLLKFKGAKNVKKFIQQNSQIDVSLGVWFERLDEDGDDKESEIGRFLGFTVSVGPSLGIDAGGAYIRAKTVQKCDEFTKCAEGFWAGGDTIIHITEQDADSFDASVNDQAAVEIGKDTYRKYEDESLGTFRFRKNFTVLKYDPKDGSELQLHRVKPPSAEGVWTGDGTTIVIDEQFKERTKVSGDRDTVEEYLFAAVDSGPRTRFNRSFGRTWKNGAGDKIKFRKNWTVLRYEPEEGDNARLARTDEAPPALPAPTARIDTVGQWDFHVNRATHTEEIVAQDDSGIVVRRVGTPLDRTYAKTGDNDYSSEFGGTFRFVSDTRALWISPDGKTVFQLNKR